MKQPGELKPTRIAMPTLPAVSLGRSTMQGSRLAFGAWRIAGVGDPSQITPEKRTEGRRAVLTAYEAGYTVFDLADVYGDGVCESIFGEALREASGMRERVVIASKCGVRKKGVPHPDAPYRYDFDADYILRSCEGSLRRLGTDRLDLLLLHRPDYLMVPDEVAGAFEKLKSGGKVREFGVSNFRPSQVTLLQKACPMPLAVNQVEVHLMHLDPFEDGTLDQCMAERITPMAWSPLAGGRLVDPNPIDLHSAHHAQRIHLRELLDQVARERGVSRTVIALAWLLRHPSGIIPVVGTTRSERILDALGSLRVDLTREEWYRILEVAQGRRLP